MTRLFVEQPLAKPGSAKKMTTNKANKSSKGSESTKLLVIIVAKIQNNGGSINKLFRTELQYRCQVRLKLN